MTPEDLRVACDLVANRFPGADLVKNQVGNLSILDTGGLYIGWIDLRTGEVEMAR